MLFSSTRAKLILTMTSSPSYSRLGVGLDEEVLDTFPYFVFGMLHLIPSKSLKNGRIEIISFLYEKFIISFQFAQSLEADIRFSFKINWILWVIYITIHFLTLERYLCVSLHVTLKNGVYLLFSLRQNNTRKSKKQSDLIRRT